MKKTYLATAVAALFAAPITTAIAADTLLDDVVVSSSRSEQRSFDAPASIQSVNREVIQDSGPQVNMSESLNKLPGVVSLDRQNYAQDLQISIRGFGSRTKFGVRGVRLIIDGIPATMPDGQGQSSSVSLTSTDRIEVLRGPIAQLYGNSAGGVIQAFTREAPDSPELLVQGYHGSYGVNRTDWQYAQKVGQFGLVADYSTFKTDGFRINSQAERNQFNGKFTYDHDDKTRISLIANVFDMPYAYDPRGIDSTQYGDYGPTYTRNPLDKRMRKTIEQDQVGAVISHKFDSYSNLSIRLYDGNRRNTHFNGYNSGTGSTTWVGLDRDYGGYGFDYSTKFTLLNKPASLLLGGSFDKTTEVNTKGTATGGEIDTSVALSRYDLRSAKNTDFYAQLLSHFSDAYSLTAGARSTKVKLSNVDTVGTNDNSYNKEFSSVNPVLGITIHANDRLNIFANYGRGFETPTLAELGYKSNGTSPIIGFNSSLLPSKSNHYEVGMKWIPTNSSRIDATVFLIKAKDEIVVDVTNSVETAYKNVSGTVRKGFELFSQNKLTQSLMLNAAVTYLDAEYTKQSANPEKKLPGTPKEYLFTEIKWSDSAFQKNKLNHVKGFIASAEWIGVGRIYSDDTNTLSKSAAGYGLTNIKTSYNFDVNGVSLTTYAQMNNIFDKKYIGSLIIGDSYPLEPAPGKNWMIGVRGVTRF
jgi:iron complex outermembrane recepter protein